MGERSICCVCLEPLKERRRLESCGHELCPGCLLELETKSAALGLAQACPTCRAPLPRVLRAEARGLSCARRALASRRRQGASERELLMAAVVSLRCVVDSTRERTARAAYALGCCLAELGAVEDAFRAFDRAARADDFKCEALLAAATLALDARRTTKATKTPTVGEILRVAASRGETHVAFDAAILLSTATLGQCKAGLAAAYAKKALDSFAATPAQTRRAAFQLGTALETIGDLAAADDAYRRSVLGLGLDDDDGGDDDDDDDDVSVSEEEEEFEERKEDDEGRRVVAVAYSAWRVGLHDWYDDGASGSLHLGMLRWRRRSGNSAGALLRRAVRRARLAPVRAQASLRLGLLEVDRGAPAKAAEALRRATPWLSGGALALALTKLGEASFTLGAYGQAEKALRAALKVEPDRVDALLRLAATLDAVADVSSGSGQVWRWRQDAATLRRKARARVANLRIPTILVGKGQTAVYPLVAAGATWLPRDAAAWLPTLQTNALPRDGLTSHLLDDDDDDDDTVDATSTLGEKKKDSSSSKAPPSLPTMTRPPNRRTDHPAQFSRADRAALVSRLRLLPPDKWTRLLSSGAAAPS